MDRFAANTLRTLGIIAVAIFVIVGSLVLVLLALCFGALANINGSGHPDQQTVGLAAGAVLAAALLIAGGVFIIARLSKGMVRDEPEFSGSVVPHYPLVPETTQPEIPEPPSAPDIVPPTPPPPIASTPPPLSPRSVQFPAPAPPPVPVPTPASAARVVTHFSPASRTAIRRLVLAITVKLAAEAAFVFAGWYLPLRSSAPIPFSHFNILAWGIASIAPLMVLIYALLRHPGPRAFAYSLVIPALQIFLGFFGHSATLFLIFRGAAPGLHPALSLFSLVPWFFDILILYLAWQAINLTGIHPSPKRLIIASVVIFLYTSLLPMFLVILNFLHLGQRR